MAKRITCLEDDQKIIELYISGKSATAISKIFGFSYTVVYSVLKRNNIPVRDMCQAHRKYKINENFFDVIDTEEKAYFLGFLYADGWVSPEKGVRNNLTG